MDSSKQSVKESMKAVSGGDTHSSQYLQKPKNFVRRDASGRDLILSSEGENGESEYDESQYIEI